MVCRNQPAEEEPLDTTLISPSVFVDVKRNMETKKVEASLTVSSAPHPKCLLVEAGVSTHSTRKYICT